MTDYKTFTAGMASQSGGEEQHPDSLTKSISNVSCFLVKGNRCLVMHLGLLNRIWFFQWSSIWWSCIEIAAWMLLIHGISSVKFCSFLITLAATSHSICGLRQYNQQWLGDHLVFSSLTWSQINVTEYTLTDCNGLGQTKWTANISKHKHALNSSRTYNFKIRFFLAL